MKGTYILLLVLALPVSAQVPKMSAEAGAEKQIRDSLGKWVQAANRGYGDVCQRRARLDDHDSLAVPAASAQPDIDRSHAGPVNSWHPARS